MTLKGTLIADAGSSKTDWRLLLEGSPKHLSFKTQGFNPLQNSESSISKNISEFKGKLPVNIFIDKIYFYGAGCSTPLQKDLLLNLFSENWPDARVYIDSDMLAAGRALFGDKKGIAAILGTGSNSALMYKGKIINQIPSLGFILGDEGSGAALGRRLLNAIYKRNLPEEIIIKFQKNYNLSLSELINKTYRSERPSAFLASFAPFLLDNQYITYIRRLIEEEFESFFLKNFTGYNAAQDLPVGFVGSIAYNFKDILMSTANNLGYSVSCILQTPIDGLAAYHSRLN